MTTTVWAPKTEVETKSIVKPPARRKSRVPSFVPPLIVATAVLAVWYLVSYVFLDQTRRFLLPPPHEIFTGAIFVPDILADIGLASLRTTIVALIGLLIAIVLGVAWAVAMSQARWLETSLFPYAVILQCIPILALVPLIGFWFGFEYPARVIVCVMIALFPMVSNTLFGIQSVDPGQRELFRLHGAARWTVLRKLEFPNALPAIFAGMRISAGLAVVGAIVGDFFFRRGEPGLGALISNYQAQIQSEELFAAIIAASLLGIVIFAAFGWLSRAVVGTWYESSDR